MSFGHGEGVEEGQGVLSLEDLVRGHVAGDDLLEDVVLVVRDCFVFLVAWHGVLFFFLSGTEGYRRGRGVERYEYEWVQGGLCTVQQYTSSSIPPRCVIETLRKRSA